MKVIDLLNKIANGKEVPHKIKYNGYTYKKYSGNITYWTGDKPSNTLRIDTFDLDDEVEIIEEDKEIEEIDTTLYHNEPALIDDLAYKVNELIKAVNEIKKKED